MDAWVVYISKKAGKQKENLPPDIRSVFYALLNELRVFGPNRHKWPNYGKPVGTSKKIEIYQKRRKTPPFRARI
jgi:mRNA-degrading endonuclease RelE of RelBE toxin-antitoxin system